jgi:hypothetical protein
MIDIDNIILFILLLINYSYLLNFFNVKFLLIIMGIGDWGLGIGDWGLGIGDWV